MENSNNKKSRNIGIAVTLLVVLAVVLLLLLKNLGVNDKPGKVTQTESSQVSANGTVKPKYYFEYNGVEIEVDAPAKPIIEALGEPIHYFEAQSCAFEGMDRIYTYIGFDLQTFTKNDKEFVFSISFLDDTVSTREGISLSATLDDAIKVYGDGFKNSFNQYSYIDNNRSLSFIIENNEVISIEYALVVDD